MIDQNPLPLRSLSKTLRNTQKTLVYLSETLSVLSDLNTILLRSFCGLNSSGNLRTAQKQTTI